MTQIIPKEKADWLRAQPIVVPPWRLAARCLSLFSAGGSSGGTSQSGAMGVADVKSHRVPHALRSSGTCHHGAFAFLLTMIVWMTCGTVFAEEFLARPDIPGYPTPESTFPTPRADGWEYFDVAALLVALALATYLALRRRSRTGLLLLTVASLAWFGFWRGGCVCAIGSIQNIALAIGDPTYTIPLTVLAFFALPLLFTLFFGRTFCASVCPLGAMQELTLLKPVRVPTWLEHTLGLIPFLYLGGAIIFAATGTAFLICQYDPYVGLFRLSGNANKIVFGLSILAIGVFVGRPYCRYLCPLGAIFGIFSRFSRWHVSITPDTCVQCRLCEDACPYGAIHEPTVDQTPAERTRARRRLPVVFLAAVLLVVVGGWLGRGLAVPFSRMHPDVRLAERVRLEETGEVEGTTDASKTFANSGRDSDSLYAEVLTLREHFRFAGGLFGAWIGLVLGVKLLSLSLRRRRTDYLADRANCVSCGRCFPYCPEEHVRQGLIAPSTIPPSDQEAS